MAKKAVKKTIKRPVKKAAKKVVKKAKRLKVLPKVMSKLIKIGLADLRKVEKLPNAIVDMGVYHSPTEIVCRIGSSAHNNDDTNIVKREPACIMCFAGSVMSQSLNAPMTQELNPRDFRDNMGQLEALNELRCGEVLQAAYELQMDVTTARHNELQKLNTYIPSYDRDNPEPFHKAMEKLQAKLAKAGL